MNGTEDLDRYRQLIASITPENPHREADIQASLRAFDAVQAPSRRRVWPGWLRLPALVGGAVTVAACLAVVLFLPKDASQPDMTSIAPPDVRLALPSDGPVPDQRDADILAVFSSDIPQYFALPWERASVLAVLSGVTGDVGETALFAADGRRLVVLPRTSDIPVSRGYEEKYQRFVIALAGLALLKSGADLGPDWSESVLLTEARAASEGVPARDAALKAVLAE